MPAAPGPLARARRSFTTATTAGAAVALLLFVWMLGSGRWDLGAQQVFGNFFDIQARSLLHGHWDIPPHSIAFEGFRTGGKVYTYFGPWPAVLRMPVLAVTSRLDGRLTQASLILALVVLLVFTGRLHWRIRRLVRGDSAPVSRGEWAAVAAFTFAVGGGSIVLFLASRAWVYHEATAWGVAWAVAGFDALVRYALEPRGRRLAAASAYASLGFLSRASVGSGPVIALALVAVAQAVRALPPGFLDRLRPRRLSSGVGGFVGGFGLAGGRRGRTAALLAATAVPVVLYAGVNYAKFHSFFGLPLDRQIYSDYERSRQIVLAANHGSLFNVKYAASTVLQYLRPDMLGVDHLFPFANFPTRTATIVFDLPFDTVDRTASLPAVMPLFLVLTVVGVIAAFRRRPEGAPDLRILRAPLVGGLASVATMVTIAFIAQRYLADFMPFLVVGSVAGLQVLLALATAASTRRRVAPRAVAAGLAVLALGGAWVSFSLTLRYQRTYNPPDDALRAGLISFQESVSRTFGLPGHTVLTGDGELPARAGAEDLFVAGRCEALYWSDGTRWWPVEQSTAGGAHAFTARFGPGAPGRREPLVTVGAGPGAALDRGPGGGRALVVAVAHHRGDRISVDVGSGEPGGDQQWFEGAVIPRPTGPHRVEVRLDPRLDRVDVFVDGRAVLRDRRPVPRGLTTIGRAPAGHGTTERFGGSLVEVPVDAPVCRRILDLDRPRPATGAER